MIKNILIANRGEIARRVIRTAHELNVGTVAIHSPHDRTALYVRESDHAVTLAGNTPRESYLDQDQVLHAVKAMHADAVHPGYGFLSENADFALRLRQEGVTFIGPSPEAIHALGDKTRARALAIKLGIPTPSGTVDAITEDRDAIAAATRIGYPVLLKAAAGGGGKGMRIVREEGELLTSLERARGEALTSFGDDRVYVEKYIEEPRHIEIQILADRHGNVVYLGERECSIQRRHQKLIEEAPSSAVSDTLRKQMGEAAASLAREARYEGAGTVEFLLDNKGKFYFLEVNTRLQVEHPVTECVTGLDLVREQIRIAEGEKLRFTQSDVVRRGHSIEIRIQAEDVFNDFLPSLGRIDHVRHAGGAFVRNDSALYPGLEVSGFYDSLLAKLITWDMDRATAIDRTLRALREMRISGVSTTIPFASFALATDRFRSGDISTAFVEQEFGRDTQSRLREEAEAQLLPAFSAVARESTKAEMRKLFVTSH